MKRSFRYTISLVTVFLVMPVLAACGTGGRADEADTGQEPGGADIAIVDEAKETEKPGADEADILGSEEADISGADWDDIPGADDAGIPGDGAGIDNERPGVEAGSLPGEFPMSFRFLSGAGGWSTDLVLEADATFKGDHHDSDMGDMDAEEYPNGTYYICHFTGRFENFVQINDHTCTMTLTDLKQDEVRDEVWIENDTRNIGSYPYGIEGGKTFTFYTPDTPVSELPGNTYSWYPYRGEYESETIDCYCIRNDATDESFFSELVE